MSEASVELIVQIGRIGYGVILVLLFAEMIYLTFISKKETFRHHYWQIFKGLGLAGAFGGFLFTFAMLVNTAMLAAVGTQFAQWQLPFEWYGWIAGLVIFEFWYWLQHMLGHKVRLLWCVHGPHHAPDTIHLGVGANHQLLEAFFYFPLFLGFLPALCGLPLEMVITISTLESVYGYMLHLSPKVAKWHYGPLEYFMQTPRYHQVHHGKNVRYMDRNYNSITLFWDWLMGTLQPLREDDPVEYGITRDVNVESVMDVQFGEFVSLWRDMKAAPRWSDKLRYMFKPPGWSHTGDHNTVAVLQRQMAEEQGQTKPAAE